MKDVFEIQLIRVNQTGDKKHRYEDRVEAVDQWDGIRQSLAFDSSIVAAFFYKNAKLRDYFIQHVNF